MSNEDGNSKKLKKKKIAKSKVRNSESIVKIDNGSVERNEENKVPKKPKKELRKLFLL